MDLEEKQKVKKYLLFVLENNISNKVIFFLFSFLFYFILLPPLASRRASVMAGECPEARADEVGLTMVGQGQASPDLSEVDFVQWLGKVENRNFV